MISNRKSTRRITNKYLKEKELLASVKKFQGGILNHGPCDCESWEATRMEELKARIAP